MKKNIKPEVAIEICEDLNKIFLKLDELYKSESYLDKFFHEIHADSIGIHKERMSLLKDLIYNMKIGDFKAAEGTHKQIIEAQDRLKMLHELYTGAMSTYEIVKKDIKIKVDQEEEKSTQIFAFLGNKNGKKIPWTFGFLDGQWIFMIDKEPYNE